MLNALPNDQTNDLHVPAPTAGGTTEASAPSTTEPSVAPAATAAEWDPTTLLARYDTVRAHTETLAAPLSPEDQTV